MTTEILPLSLNESQLNYTLCVFANGAYATRNQGDDFSKNCLKTIDYTFGTFTDLDSYSTKIINGEYENGNASAFVRRDKNNLIIAFRGTDDAKDVLDDMSGVTAGEFKTHYKKFNEFIKAIENYLADHVEIAHLYVTGHSLGGAMADGFLLNHKNKSLYDVTGVTFASPGYEKHTRTDLRATQFEMVSDIVGDTFQNIGNVVSLDDHVGGKGVSNHGIQNYLDYLTNIQNNHIDINPSQTYFCDYRINIENQKLIDMSMNATATSKADILRGTIGNDTLNGLQGNDLLISNGGNDTLTGGLGKDIFEFNLENPAHSSLISSKITDFVSGVDKIRFIANHLKLSDLTINQNKLSIEKYNFELTFSKNITFKLDKNIVISPLTTNS